MHSMLWLLVLVAPGHRINQGGDIIAGEEQPPAATYMQVHALGGRVL